MKRREFLGATKNILALFLWTGFLSGCGWSAKQTTAFKELALVIAFLLYEDSTPQGALSKIEKSVQSVLESSFVMQWELRWINLRTGLKSARFDEMTSKQRYAFLKNFMPSLSKSSLVLDSIQDYFKDEQVCDYLDYPNFTGEFGSCGWLVLESAVWKRYHPSQK